jgi:hypothetical protein
MVRDFEARALAQTPDEGGKPQYKERQRLAAALDVAAHPFPI